MMGKGSLANAELSIYSYGQHEVCVLSHFIFYFFLKGTHGSGGLIYIYVEYICTHSMVRVGRAHLGQAGSWGHCTLVIWLGGIHKPKVPGY